MEERLNGVKQKLDSFAASQPGDGVTDTWGVSHRSQSKYFEEW